MKKRSLPLGQVYRHLEPGPVVLLTTAAEGQENVMTLSWHLMLEFEPPLVGLVVSNRDFSFRALKKTKECVINIPTVKLGPAVVGCGNTSGKKIDKFKRFSLTSLPASCVSAPLIDECYASLECRVVDGAMITKYNLFIVEVLKAWIDPLEKLPKTLHHTGLGKFRVAGRALQLPSRMK